MGYVGITTEVVTTQEESLHWSCSFANDELAKLKVELNPIPAKMCLFGTFFGTRQYPKVQKFTKHPSPDYF